MSGSRAAVEALYHDLGPALLAYARSLLREAATAEDVVQQVFLTLLSRREPLPVEPRPYLFRSVRNAALNRLRSARRELAHSADPSIFVAGEDIEALVPDLERALADLPEEQREIVMLRVWGDLTLAAAAEVVGVPLNTAASRYRYGLDKLRQRFGVESRKSHV